MLLGIYPNELKTYVHLHVNVDESFIHISQNVDVTKRSFNSWMDKQTVVYIYNEILLSNKKKQHYSIKKKKKKTEEP